MCSLLKRPIPTKAFLSSCPDPTFTFVGKGFHQAIGLLDWNKEGPSPTLSYRITGMERNKSMLPVVIFDILLSLMEECIGYLDYWTVCAIQLNLASESKCVSVCIKSAFSHVQNKLSYRFIGNPSYLIILLFKPRSHFKICCYSFKRLS